MDAGHLAVMFAGSVARHGELPATRVRVDGEFVVQTYAELGAQVRQLAARLIDRGLAPGDRVAIFSTNRPEWSLADLACATAALVSVPLYPTSTPSRSATSSAMPVPPWLSWPARPRSTSSPRPGWTMWP